MIVVQNNNLPIKSLWHIVYIGKERLVKKNMVACTGKSRTNP